HSVLEDLFGIEGFLWLQFVFEGGRDPVSANKVDVQRDEDESRGREQEHVQREKTSEGDGADAPGAGKELGNVRSGERDRGADLGGDHGSPISPDIPGEQVAGEPVSKSEKQKDDADDPG